MGQIPWPWIVLAGGLLGVLVLSIYLRNSIRHTTEVEGLAQELLQTNESLRRETDQRIRAETLRELEARYHSLFDSAPLSIWDADLTPFRDAIDKLELESGRGLRDRLTAEPKLVQSLFRSVLIRDVNPATLDLFKGDSKDQLVSRLDQIFDDETLPALKEFAVAVSEGRNYFETEISPATLQGDRIDALMALTVPGEQGEYGRVIVTLTDITELKQKESDNARLDMLNQTAVALAHHVQNAVTPIIGMAMLSADKNELGSDFREMVLEKGRRIAAIINALIEMSETGDAPTIESVGPGSRRMLDMEVLIQRYMQRSET